MWLGWFPVAGYSPLEYGWLKTVRSLVLPAFALGLVQSALIARIARWSMLDVLREQFIVAGRAKGLGERAVVYKHAFKNALIPTMTIIGISFAIPRRRVVGCRDRVQHPGPRRLVAPVLRGDVGAFGRRVCAVAGVCRGELAMTPCLVRDPRSRWVEDKPAIVVAAPAAGTGGARPASLALVARRRPPMLWRHHRSCEW